LAPAREALFAGLAAYWYDRKMNSRNSWKEGQYLRRFSFALRQKASGPGCCARDARPRSSSAEAA
jgi:hypothetical protein